MKPKLLLCALSSAATMAAARLRPPIRTPVTGPLRRYTKKAGDWKPAQPSMRSLASWWNFFMTVSSMRSRRRSRPPTRISKRHSHRLEQARRRCGTSRSYLPTVTASAGASRTRTRSTRPNTHRKPAIRTICCCRATCPTRSMCLAVYAIRCGRAGRAQASPRSRVVDLSMHSELALDISRSQRGYPTVVVGSDCDGLYRALELTQNLYHGAPFHWRRGTGTGQLDGSHSGRGRSLRRAQTEHAIAVLVDQQASTFHLDPLPLSPDMTRHPSIQELPSQPSWSAPEMLRSRAPRCSANASVGVARAAYFPVFNLAGVSRVGKHTRFQLDRRAECALGSGLVAVATLFDGGRAMPNGPGPCRLR